MAEQKSEKVPSKLVGTDGKTVSQIVASPYGECELTRPDSANVYDNRGSKSTVAVNVKIPILAIGAIMTATVYARMGADGKFKADPAPAKGIVLRDDSRDVFRAHVNRAVNAWPGKERAFREAYDRLVSGPKVKGDKANDAEIDWTPPTRGESQVGVVDTTAKALGLA